MTYEELVAMKYHETKLLDNPSFAVQILRVPNGWIYTSFDKEHRVASSAFVPVQIKGDTNP